MALEWALGVEPRGWQREALALWRETLRGTVSVVTGGGKTVFAQMCMLAFHERFPQGRTIIVVPTLALLDQWFVSLTEDLRAREDEIACYSGQDHPDQPNRINILVLNTARREAPRIAADMPSFLIVDECHRIGSPANAAALIGPYRATLGLSATPERDYDSAFEAVVAPVLGEVIYRYDYSRAFADHVISPFEIINVKIELLSDEAEKHQKLTQRAVREHQRIEVGTGSEQVLRRILQKRAAVSAAAAMRVPIAARLAENHRGQRTVIFHERVDAAETIHHMLGRRNHSVTLYHSRIGPSVRRDNLRLYRRGLFDILVSCRALDEGMNVPETMIAIIASGTASRRQRIQRLGRVLRPARGKTAATIYTLYATAQEEARLREEEERLDGVAGVQWWQGQVHGKTTRSG